MERYYKIFVSVGTVWTVWTLDKADRVFLLVASPDIPGLGLDRPQPSWDPAWCPSISTGYFWGEIAHTDATIYYRFASDSG